MRSEPVAFGYCLNDTGFGGDVTGLVPPNVLKRLRSRINGG
jgi:hypothetical protein